MKQGDTNKTLASKLDEMPHLFDPDMAKHIQDTLSDEAPINLKQSVISNPSNLFAPTPLSKDESRIGANRLMANYMGLIGPVSALPPHYTHEAIKERKRRSSSFFDFLELFADELRTFFIKAHRKYRLASLLQLYNTKEENQITKSIFSLIGFSSERQKQCLSLSEEIPLYYAGYLIDQRRTAVNLERMVADYLNFPVKVHQFHKQRMAISIDEQTRMIDTLAGNSILGETAIAGAFYTSRQGAIRLSIGPLNYSQYLSLMPNRPVYKEFVDLIRLYCGPSLSFDIQLILAKEHIPQTQLNASSPIGRLGWDCWAIQSAAKKDSLETVFNPDLSRAD